MKNNILFLLLLLLATSLYSQRQSPVGGNNALTGIISDWGPRIMAQGDGSRFHMGFDYPRAANEFAVTVEAGSITYLSPAARTDRLESIVVNGWRYLHCLFGRSGDGLYELKLDDNGYPILIIRSNATTPIHVYVQTNYQGSSTYTDNNITLNVERTVGIGQNIFRPNTWNHLHLDRGYQVWVSPFSLLPRTDTQSPANTFSLKYNNNGTATVFPVNTSVYGNIIIESEVDYENERDLDNVILQLGIDNTFSEIFAWRYTGGNHMTLTSLSNGTSNTPAYNIRQTGVLANIRTSVDEGVFPRTTSGLDVFKYNFNSQQTDPSSTLANGLRYPDGQYTFRVTATDLGGNNTPQNLVKTIDNLRPYIQKVEIRKNTANGDALYTGEWAWSGTSLNLSQQSPLSATANDDIWVRLTASEPMTSLSLNVLTYNQPSTMAEGTDGKTWVFTIPKTTFAGNTSSSVQLSISGTDLASHPLQVNANQIPVRDANGVWTGAVNEGSDVTHYFNFTIGIPQLSIAKAPISGNDLAEGFFPFTAEITNDGNGEFSGTVAMVLHNIATGTETEIAKQTSITIPAGDKFYLQNLNYELTEGQYQVITRYTNDGGATWVNVPGTNNPYTIKVTKLGGVDMTNATIAGLRIDDTKNIKFVFKGNSNFSPGDPTIELDSASATLQRVFMQALIVPNYNQWISINPDPQYYIDGTGGMHPVAPEPFMNTEMAYRMLESDAYIKIFWDTTFRQQADTYWNDIVTNSRVWPSLKAKGFDNRVFCPSRACIIPGLVSANASGGDIFIDSAQLNVESSNFNCCFVKESPLPLSQLSFDERKVIDSLLDIYSKNYTERLQARNISFKTSLNSDKRYSRMHDIYPAIALAHWYKRQANIDPYFQSIIDCNDLTNLTDPAFTEADLLKIYTSNPYSYRSYSPSGKPLISNFSGGNVMTYSTPTVAGPMSVNQQILTDSVIDKNKTLVRGDTVFFSGGTPFRDAPDIYPLITSRGTTNPVAGYPSTIKVLLTNAGNRAASDVKTTYYYRREGSSSYVCIGDTTIANIAGFSSIPLKKAFTLPGEGKYYLEVRTDEQNAINEAKENNNMSIDSITVKTNVPEVSIVSPAIGSQIIQTRVKLKGGAFDNMEGNLHGSSLQWSSDKDGLLGAGESVTVDSLSAGLHAISLTATNRLGIMVVSKISVEVFKPGSPIVQIISPTGIAPLSSYASLNFVAIANDYTEGELDNCEWHSNKQGFLGKGTSITANLIYTGVHEIIAKAHNSAGNYDADTILVTVQDGYPKINVTKPTLGNYFQHQDIVFLASANDIQDGNIEANIKWVSNLVGQIGLGSTFQQSIAPGEHTITASVIDKDGLASDTSFILDIKFTPPVPIIEWPIVYAEVSKGNPVTLKGTATDIQDGKINGTQLIWTSDLQGFLGIGENLTLDSLAKGNHLISLKVTDSDDVDSTTTAYIYVGESMPAIYSMLPIDYTVTYSKNPVAFSAYVFDEQDKVMDGNNLVWLSDKDGLIGKGSGFTYSNLSAGDHKIRLIATDSDGNSTTKTVNVKVYPSRRPYVKLVWPKISTNIMHSAIAPLEAIATDPEDGTLNGNSVVWYSNIDGIIGSGSKYNHTFASTGIHKVTVTATDSSSLTSSASKFITVEQLNPTVSIITPVGGSTWKTNDSIQFMGLAEDYEDGTLTGSKLVWISNRDGFLGTGTSIKTKPLSVGTHYIKLTATDSQGGIASEQIQIAVNALHPPTVVINSPASNATYARGASINFSATANDYEDGALSGNSIVWESNLSGELGKGSLLTLSNLVKGNHSISVTATDSHGLTATAKTQITVSNNKPVAAISSPGNNAVFYYGQTINFSGTANDAEDGVLSGTALVWASGLDGQIGTGGNVSSSGLSVGAHNIRLTATDSDGAKAYADISVKIAVQSPPSISVSSPANNTNTLHGNPIVFSATALDCLDKAIQGSNIQWVSSGDGSLGTGSQLTISNLSVGVHTITVTASDDYGKSTSSSTTVIVSQRLPVAAITKPVNRYIVADTANIIFEGSGTDYEDGILQGTSLVWNSDRDGQIGIGKLFTKKLSTGRHTITLTATDAMGGKDMKSIVVVVQKIYNGTITQTPDNANCLTYKTANTDTVFYIKVPRNAKVSEATFSIAGKKRYEVTTKSSLIQSLRKQETIQSEMDMEALRREQEKEYRRLDSIRYRIKDSIIRLEMLKYQEQILSQKDQESAKPAAADVPEIERQALINFYDSTNGDSWTTKTNWKTNNPVSTWHGVTVENGHVTRIWLPSNNLSGSLPQEIGNLPVLKILYLYTNNLQGSIPKEIGNLSSLTTLNCYYNHFSGELPKEIGNLKQLKTLNFQFNHFSGIIPPEIENLTNLQELYLGSNRFSGQSFPEWICNLTSLTGLDLSGAKLTGTIPTEIKNLTQLTMLFLNSNKLTGAIPSEINSLSKLHRLFLYGNRFTDLPILAGLSVLPNSSYINVFSNRLTFEDIEPNIGLLKCRFTYSSQAKVGLEQTVKLAEGSSYTFFVLVGGSHNTYQWQKNGLNIPSATNSNYTINKLKLTDAGDYTCIINNTVATALTLYSYPVHLQVIPNYPTNPLLDVGNDNTSDWSYSGVYSATQTTANLANAFNSYIMSYTGNDSTVNVPVRMWFSVGGKLELCNFNIQYSKVDITPPTISSVTINPVVPAVSSTFELTAIVTDNVYVSSVDAGFNSGTYNFVKISDTQYKCTLPAYSPGRLPLTITATDNSRLQTVRDETVSVYTPGVDFAVNAKDITFSPLEINEGESVNVGCKIRNNGNTNATNVTLALLLNGIETATQTVNIGQMAETSANFVWIPAISDTTIAIVADYDNKFAESDETNNTATIKVYPKDMSPPAFTGFELSPNPSVEGGQVDILAYVKDNVGIDKVACTWNGVETLLAYSFAYDAYTGKTITAVTGTTIAICTATDINGLTSKRPGTITILPLKPDVSIAQSDIQIPTGTYSQGQAIELNLLVHNYGGVAVNACSVKFLVDGNLADTKNINIGFNSTSLVPFSWITDCGNHNFSFILDESNLIEEINEDNNTASLPVNFCTCLPPVIGEILVTPDPVLEMGDFSISAAIEFTNQEDSVVAVFKGKRYPMPNISGSNYMLTIPSGQYGKYDALIIAYDANGTKTEVYTSINIYKLKADIWQISEEIILPSSIKEGNLVNVSSTVHNTGNIAVSNVLVYLYANERLVDSTIVSIPANGKETTSFEWMPGYADKYLKVVADPHNLIVETDESNNTVMIAVDVEDNTPPVIENLTVMPNPFYQGKEASVTLKATDNTPLELATYTWNGIVDTMEFNPVSKNFEANITSLDTGTFVLLCHVYDISGLESQQSLTVEVIPQLADLSINDFDIGRDSANMNWHDTANIYLNVHNKGGTAVHNAELRFIVDGVLQESVLIDLQPYSQQQLTFLWQTICENHDFTFTVDENNSIPEMNEDNNTVTRSMCFCYPVPPTILSLSTDPVSVVQDSSFILKALVTDNDSIDNVSAVHQGQSFKLLYNIISGHYEARLNNDNVLGDKNIIVRASNTYNLSSNARVQYQSISKLPDISIGQVFHVKTLMEAGRVQSSGITVKNTGGSDVNGLLVYFYANNRLADSVIINVSALSLTDVSFEWVSTIGDQALMILADPDNRVMESNENNNQWTGNITAYDTDPPVIIKINANDTVFEGEQINISTVVTDNDTISGVQAIYNNISYNMVFDNVSETYKVTIPKALLNCAQFDVLATDLSGLTARQGRSIRVYETLPDLEVKSGDISTLVLNTGASVKVTTILHNNGCLPVTNAKVRILIDGKVLDSTTVSIDRMKSLAWEVMWSSLFGYHKVSVQIDPDNKIHEINETNNDAEIIFCLYDITPPPNPNPVCNISDWSNNSDFSISWEKVNDVSGIKDYRYSLNNGQWISTGLDTTVNLNINNVGETQIQVVAEDSAGNVSIPGEVFALFDNVNPEAPALSETHCGREWTLHDSPMLLWNNPGDEGSGINTYRIMMDNQNTIDVANINNYHLTIYKSGVHSFRVKAIDKTGNESEWSNEVKVWIDLSCPHKTTIYSTSHPDQNQWYNTDSVQLNWDTPQDTSYIKGYFYLLNRDSKAVPNQSAFWYTGTDITLNSLPFMTEENVRIPEGTWYFHLVSMDAVGNMDTIGAYYRINIDRSPPQTSFQLKKSNGACPNIIQLSSKDYYSGIAKIYYRVNQGDWTEGSEITIHKPGINNIDFYSEDMAGNVEEVQSTTYNYNGISVDHTVKNLTCQDSRDGAIMVDVSGGVPPYVYHWSDQSVSKDLKNVNEGVYELIIKDQQACQAKLTDTVIGYKFEIDLEKKDDSEGTCTGSAIIHVTGGEKPFKYYWKEMNSYGDSLYNKLCEGVYSVVVTDANNCSVSDRVLLLGNGEDCIVYPNPNDGEFWIALPGAKTESVEIIVMDISGRIIIKDTYPFMNRPIKMAVPNKHIGVFLLKVKLDNNKTFLKKVFVAD